jgi:hypothetical protein
MRRCLNQVANKEIQWQNPEKQNCEIVPSPASKRLDTGWFIWGLKIVPVEVSRSLREAESD